jgi:hypothetical protein
VQACGGGNWIRRPDTEKAHHSARGNEVLAGKFSVLNPGVENEIKELATETEMWRHHGGKKNTGSVKVEMGNPRTKSSCELHARTKNSLGKLKTTLRSITHKEGKISGTTRYEK